MKVDPRPKARGVLLGAAAGDALGAPFEGLPAPVAPHHGGLADAVSHLRYTDDTAMTLALAESLAAVGDLDEDDLAATFVRHWQAEPWRGYARGTFELLRSMAAGRSWREAAPAQFQGQGSWGNGAAMRVAPVAILAAGDIGRTLELARRSARVTHAHPLGIEGAALQAAAVALALGTPREEPIEPRTFLARLRPLVAQAGMTEQLGRVEELVEAGTPAAVAEGIGCGIDALSSVPAAIAAALRGGGSMADAIGFAIAIGGDTDTIASMSGAIVGAHLGAEAIPGAWVRRLEDREHLLELADRLVAASEA